MRIYYLLPFPQRRPFWLHIFNLRGHLIPLRALLARIQIPIDAWNSVLLRGAFNTRDFRLSSATDVDRLLRRHAAQDPVLSVAGLGNVNAEITRFMTVVTAVRDVGSTLGVDLGLLDDLLRLMSDDALAANIPLGNLTTLSLSRAQRRIGHRAGRKRLRAAGEKELVRSGDRRLFHLVDVWFRVLKDFET